MLLGIEEAALPTQGYFTLCCNRCGIAHFTSKELSHFVKTDFEKLPKEGTKQLVS